MRGGGTLDRVVVNKQMNEGWVRMYMDGGNVKAIVIMNDNDTLRLKYIAYVYNGIALSSTSIGNSLHIVIENVTKHMGTAWNDGMMYREEESTTITINDGSDSRVYGTWTSTIVPENVTVELDCFVVENDGTIVTANCYLEITWDESVFNRIPISTH